MEKEKDKAFALSEAAQRERDEARRKLFFDKLNNI